jgi:hypothetical protein
MIEGHLISGFIDLFDLRGNSQADCAIAMAGTKAIITKKAKPCSIFIFISVCCFI